VNYKLVHWQRLRDHRQNQAKTIPNGGQFRHRDNGRLNPIRLPEPLNNCSSTKGNRSISKSIGKSHAVANSALAASLGNQPQNVGIDSLSRRQNSAKLRPLVTCSIIRSSLHSRPAPTPRSFSGGNPNQQARQPVVKNACTQNDAV
jgi:hypothetical protein